MTDIDKDWCLNMAALEGDAEIGAGSMSQHCPNCEAQAAEIERLREEAAIHADDLEELCWIEIPEEKAALEAAIDFLRQVGGNRAGKAEQ